MADNALDTCLNKCVSNAAGKCLPERRSKRKFYGYHYVPSESDEADTLKDKFWRDLEQGKLNFLNTVDMYTRVKQPGKVTGVDCRTVSYQDPVLLSDTVAVSCLQSSIPLISAIGSVMSSRDASPPSSGYESSSIPSIGSASVTDSPTESDLQVAGSCDLFRNVAQSNSSVLKRKRKRTNKCIWQSSLRSKCRKHQTASKSLSSRRKVNSKFFRYVDAASEEADTLKDKFWRDLELGNVSAITTTDLYSSVKVSRRTRQHSLFSIRSSDHADLTEVAVTSSNGCQSPDCTNVSDIHIKCSEADDSSCNRKSSPSALDQPNDCYISEEIASVADCKLLSPCSVSVERLPFSIDDVDVPVTETCSSIVAGDSNCVLVESDRNLVNEEHSSIDVVNHSFVPSDKADCKRHWHSGRCRTGSRHSSKGAYTLGCIAGTNSRVECVRLSSLEINSSLLICHVPLAFPSTWQQHYLSGWLEDDAISQAGEVLRYYISLCFLYIVGVGGDIYW